MNKKKLKEREGEGGREREREKERNITSSEGLVVGQVEFLGNRRRMIVPLNKVGKRGGRGVCRAGGRGGSALM
jgi:hypothetical protein